MNPVSTIDHFLYTKASTYPRPRAWLIDRDGREVHTWQHTAAQPAELDDPPAFMRSWNHVEVDREGSLYAIVPQRAVLKLDRDSQLIWKAEVAAHHDLEITEDGELLVLTEHARPLQIDGVPHVIQDNAITIVSKDGQPRCEFSLYDVLTTAPVIRRVIHREIVNRRHGFAKGAPATSAGDLLDMVTSAICTGIPSTAIQLLRRMPGAPSDVLHANSLEVVRDHPGGAWEKGHVMVSLRNLNLVAVLDLYTPRVVWYWGMGVLSGQHQPSMTPAGNVLVFDNGAAVGRTRVIEVAPLTGSILWEYEGGESGEFFCEGAGGCELLPSDNILVTDAMAGRVFEVTRDKRIVWEWTTRQEVGARYNGRMVIYRMAAVEAETVSRILGARNTILLNSPVPP